LKRFLLTRSVALLFCLLPGRVSAVLVDWSTQTWTPGSLSNSFDVDPGNPGNDVTVTVSGDTGQLQPSLVAPNAQTPAITGALDGGFSPSHVNLELALNLANNTQAVTVTVNFSALYVLGVSNVSFKLFDIDFSNATGNTYQDVIKSITATSILGATIAPTITNVGANVSLTGSGTNQTLSGLVSTVDKGVGSDAGNATITFNATGIASITFTYTGGALFADPTYQHIGIDNIDYSVVPETNPAPYSFIVCAGLAVWTTLQHRTKKRRAETRFG
jgi:hypothetical protein